MEEVARLDPQGTYLMQAWYNGNTKAQKILMYIVSVLFIVFYGIGLPPLLLLLYLEFGKKRPA